MTSETFIIYEKTHVEDEIPTFEKVYLIANPYLFLSLYLLLATKMESKRYVRLRLSFGYKKISWEQFPSIVPINPDKINYFIQEFICN